MKPSKKNKNKQDHILLESSELTDAVYGDLQQNRYQYYSSHSPPLSSQQQPQENSRITSRGLPSGVAIDENFPLTSANSDNYNNNAFNAGSFESTWTENTRRLDGVLLKWKQTRNWDKFYEKLYEYYVGRGFVAIVMARIFNLLTLLFVVFFATFLIGCIDHANISQKKQLSDAILPGCPVLSGFHQISLLIFILFWLSQAFKLAYEYPALLEMRKFYLYALEIKEKELKSTPWGVILEKIERIHATVFANDINPRISSLDIVNRIMRRENYLIALFNKDILNLKAPVPSYFPLVGGRQMMTKVMEWNLNICLMDYIFGETDQGREIGVKPVFLRDGNRTSLIAELRRRFVLVGIFNLIMAPFTLVFLTIYFLFKYGAEYHRNPTQIGARSYSPIAEWKFRDFNELPHLFQHRLRSSYEVAMKYVSQFSQEKLSIVAGFIAYVAGAIALSLTVLSLLDDDILLNFQITPGRSTLWYLGLFGIIWSASRALIPNPYIVYNTQELMETVIQYTHYYPKDWENSRFDSDKVATEFTQLFDFRVTLFILELLSIAFAPFILLFQLPDCAPEILDFFRQFTVHVDGIGNVCTYSMFDFRKFNQIRGLQRNAPSQRNTAVPARNDKMKTSMINFKRNYTSWEPNNPEDSHFLHEIISQDEQNNMMKRPAAHSSPITNYRMDENYHSSPSAFIDRVLEEERKLDYNSRAANESNSGYLPPPAIPSFNAQRLNNEHPMTDLNEESDEGHEMEDDPLGVNTGHHNH